MAVKSVAILSPGDMGHAVGQALGQHGLDVLTCLEGRSDRTRGLAVMAGIRDVASYEEMVDQADLILSILVPAEAVGIAEAVARSIESSAAGVYYADCNAISPMTTKAVEAAIVGAGGRYIDGSIIGGPPGRGPVPRFYTSGPDTQPLEELDGKGIEVRPIGAEIGRASAIKMCYAGLTKGTNALHVAVLSAAESLGVSEELANEFRSSQSDTYSKMENQVPHLAGAAFRWIGEMEQIAATFEHAGTTPHFHEGSADIYRMLSGTPFAEENPETADPDRTLTETIRVVSEYLASRAAS